MFLSVKIGNASLELEGSKEFIEKLLDDELRELIEFLQSKREKNIEILPETEGKKEYTGIDGALPVIGQTKTLVEAVEILFSHEWGRTPRSLGEVMDVLKQYGLYYSHATITNALKSLMRKGKIRRIGERGSYQYVAVPKR